MVNCRDVILAGVPAAGKEAGRVEGTVNVVAVQLPDGPYLRVPTAGPPVVAQVTSAEVWVRSVTYGARVREASKPPYGVTGTGWSGEAPAAREMVETIVASTTTPTTEPIVKRFSIPPRPRPCPYGNCPRTGLPSHIGALEFNGNEHS